MGCHASANLELAIPHWVPPEVDPDADTAANRGTRAHEILAEIVAGGLPEVKNFLGALEYVERIMCRRRFKKLIETEVKAHWLHSRSTTTADLVLYLQDEIHIIDWKWGKIPVQATDNQQLLFYAAAYSHMAPKASGVHVHIVQPAINNYDEWVIPAFDIADFMRDSRLHEKQILQGDTTFAPGDWCTFCPANPHGRGDRGRPPCPTLTAMYYPEILDEDEILGK